MSMHVVLGAGPVGSAVTRLLAEKGEQVRVISRRGSGPRHAAIECVAADATDPVRLTALSSGAVALYNCANPDYTRWAELWPPLARAVLTTAEATGAVLAIMGNLYGYGPVDGPLVEDLPLAATSAKGRVRIQVWEEALAAHAAGRVRVTEARASDFIGAGARSMMTELVLPNLLKGKAVRVPADLDAAHAFSYPGDAARTLVALAADERAWGHAWHVPHDRPTTIRAAAVIAAGFAGLPEPKLSRVPAWQVRAAGLFSRDIRAFAEMSYQFTRPFLVNSDRAEQTFGLTATPIVEAIREAVAAPMPGAGPGLGVRTPEGREGRSSRPRPRQ